MSLTPFVLALLGLLMTPGPTNTLLALAGAERGWRAALLLIPFEVLAYLAVCLPLAFLGDTLLAAHPWLGPAIKAAAAAWVALLAVRLWHLPVASEGAPSVTARRVLVTTLLNPKALIIGLVLLPGPEAVLRAVVFSALVVGVAAVWAAMGACLAGRGDCPARRGGVVARRLAALWLAVLSAGLLVNAGRALL